MKGLKNILITILSAFYLNCSAQNLLSIDNKKNGWNTLWIEYNPIKLKYDISGLSDDSPTGFSIGLSKAYSINKKSSLYLEPGISIQYDYFSDSSPSDTAALSYYHLSTKIPINFLYHIEVTNSNIILLPFAGVTFRYNLLGIINMKEYSSLNTNRLKASITYDLFNDSDMKKSGLLDGKPWKRFQVGWQIGLKSRIGNNFIVGVSYGKDFSEIAYKTTVQTTTISMGYCF